MSLVTEIPRRPRKAFEFCSATADQSSGLSSSGFPLLPSVPARQKRLLAVIRCGKNMIELAIPA
jgi:hypothetical protein